MQQPTCRNVRIRSTQDAHRIFFAVQKGILQMVTRRLDANERLALATGCVYAWEERGPHNEVTGLGIERFTEGRRWSPSRVRDEFLFYYEKYTDNNQLGSAPDPQPPRDWDPLVKQTYSVWVETDKGRRKWHLTAYFTQTTVDDLGTIDGIPGVKDLVVPPGLFKSTRVVKSRGKSDEPPSRADTSSSGVARTYAPFSSLYNRYPSHSASPEASESVHMYEPYGNMHYNPYPPQYPSAPASPQLTLPSAAGTSQYYRGASAQPHDNSILTQPIHPTSSSRRHDKSTAVDAVPSSPVTATRPSMDAHRRSGYQAPAAPARVPYPDHTAPSHSAAQGNFSSSYDYQQGPYPFLTGYLDPDIHPPLIYPDLAPDARYGAPLNQRVTPPRATSQRHDAPAEPPEPYYELYESSDDEVRRGDIGPDRDLAPIQTLTRRHPYRRDPLDDKALRLLPR